MTPTLDVETLPFTVALERYAAASGKDVERAALQAFRGVVRRAMGITPPASSQSPRGRGGALTLADRRRGQDSLERDLSAIFKGVPLKGERTERHPDVAGIHRRLFVARKIPGRRLRSDLPGRTPYYVDEKKLRALRTSLLPRIGRLAAGWMAGALAVKLPGVPAWVRRHGNRGGTARLILGISRSIGRLQTGLGATVFTVAHNRVPSSIVPEMQRRLDLAVVYETKALQRQAAAIMAKQNARFGRR
jgi:hypothetical protein